MKQGKPDERNILLDPEQRLCPVFDSCSIKKCIAPDREKMGIPVLDNCAEDHIQ